MLQQLNMLRKEMYRGYYIMDRFRYHDREEENTKDHQVSNSFAPSKFNPAKRIRFCRTSGQSLQQQLQQVLASLEATIEDTSEFFMFLNSYPRLNRQPYSMHLVLDKCLFNHQMEMEHIMNFLLKDNTSSNQNPGVLPIIGPSNVGKSTLIEHACNDERVRNHFFQIVCFSDDDLEDANMVTLRNCGVIKHQNHATGGERILIIVELIRDINEGAWRRLYSASKTCAANGSKIIVASRSDNISSFGTTHALRVKFFTQEAYWYFFKHQNHATDGERILIIIELIRDIDEGAWRRLYSAYKNCVANDSKIIVASRSDKIASFGTTKALRVTLLTQEAYWYFFKLRTFGSTDAAEHPKMASIAMDIAIELNGCFMGSSIYTLLLRANFNAQYWSMALAIIRKFRKLNLLLYGACFFDGSWQRVEPAYVRRNMVLCRTNFARSEAEVPMLSMQDFLFGSVRPQGKFKVLAWKSHLPPYYNHMFNCEESSISQMETLFSAILGELASRSFSFLINKCSSKLSSSSMATTFMEEKIQRLERMLLRLATAIEEVDGKHITNQAMLRQVNMLRQDMHKGYYALDTFRIQKHQEEDMNVDDDNEVSYNTLSLSKFNSIKRARVLTCTRRHGDMRELDQMVDIIEITMAGMAEFVMLLNNYPSMHRQPYNTYMFMDKCMFGRQMEMEHIIKFLLHPEPPYSDIFDVLPIIGPAKVGKSTLVEHVCNDERVRNHFSRIIFLSDSDLSEQKSLLTLRDSGVIRHKHNSSSASIGGERLLVVVELTEDVADDEWRRMYSSSRSCISAGSKIIITSRSEKIAKLGTTQPLRLKFLSREAYWYFFKVLAFGSSDPKDYPKVASVSMAMFNGYFDREMHNTFIGPFIDLNNMASFIQASIYDRDRLSLRKRFRTKESKSQLLPNRGSGDSGVKSKCVVIPKADGTVNYYCEIFEHCRVALAHAEDQKAPKIGIQDILSGRVEPHGKFDLVLWRSHLPPYYSYIYSSEIHEFKENLMLVFKRFTLKNKSRLRLHTFSLPQFLSQTTKLEITLLHMETFLSAILGDLASRSISFLINKSSKPTALTVEERLQRLLLRARIILEEADERLITNQSMLQQLNILRKEMYRGYYTLDRFRCHVHEADHTKDHEVSNHVIPSKFNPAKRIRFCRVSGKSLEEQLQQVFGSLEVTIEDMGEVVMFLNSCPRLCRQPYSMHLLLDKCLLGRQMEMEHIMNFLLKEDIPGDENTGVLPIIGPWRVGKSTLIEHACADERVRNRFFQIVHFSDDDLEDANMVTLRDCGVIKHQNRGTGEERLLIIIELIRDIDEAAWSRLYSASKRCVAKGSKIIVASRSDKIARFGTTQALRVTYFTQEAYWYFFKVRTFGSIDAEEHPKLASIAMDMAREMNGCFMGSSMYSVLLKANFNVRFWSMALAGIREFKQKNLLRYGANIDCPWHPVEPTYIRMINNVSSEYLVVLCDYQTCSVQDMVDCHTNFPQSEAAVPMENSRFSRQDLIFHLTTTTYLTVSNGGKGCAPPPSSPILAVMTSATK
uniref:NB-ARC domain-containing protein n=1 Tax=Oryza barthii TaxID=65489 RepID=A0A0D3GLM1_9ORYZ